MKPLKTLLKMLEIPNKLIMKRNDKLLDYECAKMNAEKDKAIVKNYEDDIYDAQKNYEALNNQLIEELPILNQNCLLLLRKCLNLYLHGIKVMNEKILLEMSPFIAYQQDLKQQVNDLNLFICMIYLDLSLALKLLCLSYV